MNRLMHVLSEIHRRFLWQAFAIYVVVASIAFNVSRHIAATRELPGWFTDLSLILLIIGLPIVLTTAAVQEGIPSPGRSDPAIKTGSASGRQTQTPTPPRTGIARIFTWRNAVMGGVAAFTLWAIIAVSWLILAEQIVNDIRNPPPDASAVDGGK